MSAWLNLALSLSDNDWVRADAWMWMHGDAGGQLQVNWGHYKLNSVERKDNSKQYE